MHLYKRSQVCLFHMRSLTIGSSKDCQSLPVDFRHTIHSIETLGLCSKFIFPTPMLRHAYLQIITASRLVNILASPIHPAKSQRQSRKCCIGPVAIHCEANPGPLVGALKSDNNNQRSRAGVSSPQASFI